MQSIEKQEVRQEDLQVSITDNWTTGKRLYHAITPCLFAFLITLGTSVPEPAIAIIMKEFCVGRLEATMSITLYTIGLALGPLLFAPLSETYGRRWIYILASTSLLSFAAGAGAAQSFASYLICRFLSGMLGSVGIAMGAGTVADVWPHGRGRASASLMFVLGPFLAPSLAPFIVAYFLEAFNNDWRWTQWFLLLVGFPIWILILGMRETSTAKRSRDGPPRHLQRSLSLPLKMLCSDPIIFALTLHTSFGYAMIFSFFSSFSYILTLDYAFHNPQSSLCLLSLAIGYFCAILLFLMLEAVIRMRLKSCQQRLSRPEDGLIPGIAGGVLLLAGETWYAFSARRGASWAVFVAAGIPIGGGAFMLFLSAINYIMQVYDHRVVASAIAANGAIRYSLGAICPLFTIQMYERLGAHWASGTFALISLLLLPLPWVLMQNGQRLRTRLPKRDMATSDVET
ncbi:major facilitator superfamily domain-containing protein [Aspergillus welwitschiae]|uniref:Major facilitator superfamily domain-containing protein n=1 Tax=Aspergillus welwitschiae TaxID=1341132 RepID=A0A3F3PI94_9EURO|nr:major facilitator superfamily domain-containing protein [Aspergillus welwitschiae]RDH26638.1 major facilitator superfamily domain-containing protein [Aspergillus welwitschiae]